MVATVFWGVHLIIYRVMGLLWRKEGGDPLFGGQGGGWEGWCHGFVLADCPGVTDCPDIAERLCLFRDAPQRNCGERGWWWWPGGEPPGTGVEPFEGWCHGWLFWRIGWNCRIIRMAGTALPLPEGRVIQIWAERLWLGRIIQICRNGFALAGMPSGKPLGTGVW